jgi:hypothetical protein
MHVHARMRTYFVNTSIHLIRAFLESGDLCLVKFLGRFRCRTWLLGYSIPYTVHACMTTYWMLMTSCIRVKNNTVMPQSVLWKCGYNNRCLTMHVCPEGIFQICQNLSRSRLWSWSRSQSYSLDIHGNGHGLCIFNLATN